MDARNRIVEAVDRLAQAGRLPIRRHREDDAETFAVDADRWRLEIVVAPKWLGLTFEVLDSGGKPTLAHRIDTDLYDISQPRYAEFASETEEEIVDFVGALATGEVRVGSIGDRPAMTLPTDAGWYRIHKGRFVTSGKHFESVADAESGGHFEPLLPAAG